MQALNVTYEEEERHGGGPLDGFAPPCAQHVSPLLMSLPRDSLGTTDFKLPEGTFFDTATIHI
jgi:hypothetical protein